MVQVSIHFIDGSVESFSEDEFFLHGLNELQRQGFEGKALVHELLKDHWKVTPRFVQVSSTTSSGTEVNIRINYS
ncbi:MAG: hypothetical protein D3926_00330 [Desulfobacteraceae bacterium]|nr:MAG: hypothetical protein D3926_00330 [Desulfobacteraceae bacterium]